MPWFSSLEQPQYRIFSLVSAEISDSERPMEVVANVGDLHAEMERIMEVIIIIAITEETVEQGRQSAAVVAYPVRRLLAVRLVL